MRKNQKPEDKVKAQCLERIKHWQELGYVLDYDDVSNLGRKFSPYTGEWVMNSQEGKRDLIVFLKYNELVWVILFEVKSETGTQSLEQKMYHAKFIGLKNVVYKVINTHKEVDRVFEKITGHYDKLVNQLPITVG